jgi:hypothetical protein
MPCNAPYALLASDWCGWILLDLQQRLTWFRFTAPIPTQSGLSYVYTSELLDDCRSFLFRNEGIDSARSLRASLTRELLGPPTVQIHLLQALSLTPQCLLQGTPTNVNRFAEKRQCLSDIVIDRMIKPSKLKESGDIVFVNLQCILKRSLGRTDIGVGFIQLKPLPFQHQLARAESSTLSRPRLTHGSLFDPIEKRLLARPDDLIV